MIVRQRIEQQLPALSGSERQIARLMIERYPVSALGGIEDIARLSGVSPPTVTRFVRRLGYNRFIDFQRAIRWEVQDQEVSPLALLHIQRTQPVDGLSRDERLVQELKMHLDLLTSPTLASAFDAAVTLLRDERRRVYMLGGRWSSIAAQYFGFQLTPLRGRVEVLLPPPSGVIEDRIADFDRRDLLVVYDFRRYQPQTVAFAETAAKRGLSILLFTDQALSPISDFADVIIAIPVAINSPLDTLVPALAATDIVLARLVDALGPQVEKRIRMLEQMREPNRNGSGQRDRMRRTSRHKKGADLDARGRLAGTQNHCDPSASFRVVT
jgi:DNA-binding MurR/RpiR family transcriptional regulator